MHPSQFRLGVEVWIGNIARHPGGRNNDIFLIKMQGITPLWQAFTREQQDKGGQYLAALVSRPIHLTF